MAQKGCSMIKRTSMTWILTAAITLCAICTAIIVKANATNSTAPPQQAPFTLRLHTDLTTGLTSCSMEAGNVFELASFGLTPPVTIQQVRFYAQGFEGGSGPVTVRLYAADSLTSLASARLLAAVPPVTVAGNTMTAYTVDLGGVSVDSPYVLASLEFTGATVIGASKDSLPGGRSFTTDCGLFGPANMNNVIMESSWALGIEVTGYTSTLGTAEATEASMEEAVGESTVEVTPEPTTVESTSAPTPEVTEETTVEAPTEAATEPIDTPAITLLPTEVPTEISTEAPTEAPSCTPTSTETPITLPMPEPTLEGTPSS